MRRVARTATVKVARRGAGSLNYHRPGWQVEAAGGGGGGGGGGGEQAFIWDWLTLMSLSFIIPQS